MRKLTGGSILILIPRLHSDHLKPRWPPLMNSLISGLQILFSLVLAELLPPVSQKKLLKTLSYRLEVYRSSFDIALYCNLVELQYWVNMKMRLI